MEFSILGLSGILAAFWMCFGVIYVSRLIPGYSHSNDVMSALGAKGSPASNIHPYINNYPIGILFFLFGFYLYSNSQNSWLLLASGVLVMAHGISHIVAGIFPCDEDIESNNPSNTQKVHMAAGLVMQISLLVAVGIWSFSEISLSAWFRWLSVVCLFVSIIFLVLMVRAMKQDKYVGLYQRISVGALVLWVAILNGVLLGSHS
ncbi:DUF998 domain-containing protein [Halioxenophilus aromaticivorans]|uniref:DUF998 domain-containing protein n=1 Tax=Halioxenophilus aromaticivorans TaxID=1306992 RepID=UPI0031E89337